MDTAPIFVVGSGRSGTTLLRLMLNAHPRIYLTHEASFYLIRSGLPKAPTARQYLERYLRSAAFAFMKLEPAVLWSHLGDASAPARAAYRLIMAEKAGVYGKARYGDKTPFHAAHLKDIFQDFPAARVIHVVRDPRATVASLLRMPWAPGSIGLNNLFCAKRMRDVVPFLDRILEVRLEDLLAEPEGEMRRVLAFVDEPFDPAVLDHPRHAPLDDVPRFPWFDNATRPVSPPRDRPAWLDQLSPAWIRNIEAVNRAAMERYGYKPADLRPEPGFVDRQRARLADAAEVICSLRQLARLARLSRGSRVPDPREFLVTLMQLNPRAWARYPGFVMPRIPVLEQGRAISPDRS